MEFMPIVRRDFFSGGATALQSQHAVIVKTWLTCVVTTIEGRTFQHHRMVAIHNMNPLIFFWSKGSNCANLTLYKSSLSLWFLYCMSITTLTDIGFIFSWQLLSAFSNVLYSSHGHTLHTLMSYCRLAQIGQNEGTALQLSLTIVTATVLDTDWTQQPICQIMFICLKSDKMNIKKL